MIEKGECPTSTHERRAVDRPWQWGVAMAKNEKFLLQIQLLPTATFAMSSPAYECSRQKFEKYIAHGMNGAHKSWNRS